MLLSSDTSRNGDLSPFILIESANAENMRPSRSPGDLLFPNSRKTAVMDTNPKGFPEHPNGAQYCDQTFTSPLPEISPLLPNNLILLFLYQRARYN